MEPEHWSATIEEALGLVIASLSDEDKAAMAAMAEPELELIGLHFGLGAWIRNNLGLWKGDDRLTMAVRTGDQPIYPDDASMVIVEAVWRRLREMVPKVH
jgi:hypothetical protein